MKRSLPNKAKELRFESLENRELLSVNPLETSPDMIPQGVVLQASTDCAESEPAELIALGLDETPGAAQSARVPTSEILSEDFVIAPYAMEATQATPTVWVVDTTADTVTSDAMSLRKAIQSALGGDVIEFSPSLNGATISVTSPLSVTRSSLTIDASALSDGVTLDGGGQYRIMDVAASVNSLTITGVGFANGYTSNESGYEWIPGGAAILFRGESLQLSDCSFTDNESHSYSTMRGGAIHVSSGILSAESCEFKNNKQIAELTCPYDGGGAIGGESASLISVYDCYFEDNTTNVRGGAIRSYGEVIVDSSVFIGNEASGDGGAIYCEDANLTIEGSAFLGNSAGSSGGAVESREGENKEGYLIIKDSFFIQNSADVAGGAIVSDSSLIECSQISGNTANLGAGIFLGMTYGNSASASLINLTIVDNVAEYYGGAIYDVDVASTLIENSLIARNSASIGGGIYLEDGEITFRNSTITANGTDGFGGGIALLGVSVLNAYNSIIADNSASEEGPDIDKLENSPAQVNGRNVLSGFTGWDSGANRLTYNANQPLFTNATQGDYSLAANSQALNHGDNSYVTVQTDLAGKTRIIDGTVDLGAYEYSATSPTKLETPAIASTSATHNSIAVNWNATPNASGYVVAYRKFSDSSYTILPATSSTTLTIEELDAETTYYVKVYAKGDGTNYTDSSYSAVQSVRTREVPTEKLATPTIAATTATTNSVAVTWGAVENASGYVVAYKKSTDSDYTVLPSTTMTTRTIVNLNADTTYNVKVYAEGDGTNYADSDYSAVKSVKTLPIGSVETPSVTVTTDLDVVDAYDGKISLREALALYSSDGDTILFASSMKGKTITLAPENGQLDISKNITIDASNLYTSSTATPGVTISGGDATRIMQLASGKTTTLKGLAFTRGKSFGDGGAILNNGALIVQNCVFSDNDANVTHEDESIDWHSGGAIAVTTGASINADGCVFSGNNGSGVISIRTNASSTFKNCQIIDNPTYGVYFWYGSASQVNFENVVFTSNKYGVYFSSDNDSVVFSNCVFSSNNDGLYLSSDNVTVSLSNCEFSSNTYGVYAFSGSLTIDESRISNNHVGIYSSRAKVDATNVVIDNNTNNGGWGGGIYLNGGEITLRNATITNNHAGYGGGIVVQVASAVLNVYNSIIAGNTASWNGNDVHKFNASSKVNAWNVLSSFTDWSSGSNQLTYDANQPLFTNAAGGDYSLATGSQAINRGNNSYATTQTDVVGRPRIIDGTVDLGAYEYGAVAPTKLGTPTITTTTATTNSTTIKWNAVTNASGYALAYKKSTDSVFTVVSTTSTSITINGLTPDTSYDVKVYAKGNGTTYTDSDYSAVKTVKTQPLPAQKLTTPTITSTTATSNSTTVKWNAVANAAGYALAYKKSTDSVFTIVSTTSTSITINGLTPDTSYDVKVYAKGNGTTYTDSDYSAVKTVKTQPLPAQKLTTPTITSTTATSNSTTVKWNAVANAAGYALAYKKSTDSVFTIVSTTSTSITINGLTADTTYDVKVCAKGNGTTYTDSDYSAVKTVKTQPLPAQKLTTPTITTTTATSNSTTVKWNAVANAAGYVLAYKKSTDSVFTIVSTTSTSITINGLTADTLYDVKVCAKGNGTTYTDSDYSAVKTVKTQPLPAQKLTTPTITTTTSTENKIVVKWNAVENAAGYVVAYKKATDSSFTVMSATTANSRTITNLSADASYDVKVCAKGDGTLWTDSDYCAVLSVKTQPKTLAPLEAPAITSTTATDDTIVVNWSAVANASGYVVEYKLSTDPAFAAMPATSANSTTIANLTPETTYKLRVYAIGDGIDYSDSQYSIVKAVKTKTAAATALPAPVITTTTSTESKIVVKWNAVTNATGYVVAYKKATDSSFTVMSTTTANSRTIANLSADTSYDVKVCAKGDGTLWTDSDYCAVLSVRTQPKTLAPLDAPTITSTTATDDAIVVNWSAVANAAGYVVEYKLSTDSAFAAMPATTATSLTVANLTPETTYKLRVYAIGDGVDYSDSPASIVKAVKTKTAAATALPAPVITTTTSTESKIVVKWNAVENATGYVVAYKKATDSSFTVMSTTTANSRTIANLSADTSYDVKVCAKGDATLWTDSEYSAVKTVKTQPKTLAPLEAPTITSTTATDDTIVVKWNAVANASGYVVEYKRSTDPAFAAMPATTATSLTVANLTPETTYKLRVYAIGDSVDYSDSPYSIVKAVKTKTAAATTLPAPEITTTTATESKIVVKWNAVENATGYVVAYKKATDSSFTVMSATTANSRTIANLSADTPYDVKVYAKGDGTLWTDSDYCAVLSVRTQPKTLTPLDAPTITSASSTDDAIVVNWSAVANAAGYVVEYKRSTDSAFSAMPTTSATSLTIANLTPETTYKLRVYAIGDGLDYSDSPASLVKAVKTKTASATTLPAPEITTTTATESKIVVKWNAVTNATGYVVAYKKASDSSFTIMSTTTANSRTIANLSADTAYDVKVYAKGDGTLWADSEYCAVRSVKTQSDQPSNPVVAVSSYDPTARIAILNWDVVPGASTYKLQLSKNGGATWANYKTGLTTTSATVNGLYPGGAYAFRVYSGTTLVAERAFAPIALSCSAETCREGVAIVVSQTGASNATSTIAWYNVTESGDVEIVSARNSLTYTPSSSNYDIKVVATGTGDSDGSSSTLVFTGYSPVRIAGYDASTRQATLAWDAIPNAATYKLQLSKNGGETWANYKTGLTTTSTTVNGLYAGKTYAFRVYGVSGSGATLADYYETTFSPSNSSNSLIDNVFADFFEEKFFEL